MPAARAGVQAVQDDADDYEDEDEDEPQARESAGFTASSRIGGGGSEPSDAERGAGRFGSGVFVDAQQQSECGCALACLASALLAFVLVFGSAGTGDARRGPALGTSGGLPARHTSPGDLSALVSRVAFGSCTSYDLRPQPVWTEGVIPSKPDAWIWGGDMVYMDDPIAQCHVDAGAVSPRAVQWQAQCNCTSDFLHQAPYSCTAGNMDHILRRVNGQLRNTEYSAFLEFMCPKYLTKGAHPPAGTDARICPKAIIGTYDDHDYAWNNGNTRLPSKHIAKGIWLDMVGESQDSPRRSTARGIEWKYTLNKGRAGKEIDVFLLDERYNRATLPCYVRRGWCEGILRKGPVASNHKYAFCHDFLKGGLDGMGTCCKKDEHIFLGWCLKPAAKSHKLYREACDPTFDKFGFRSIVLDRVEGIKLATGNDGGTLRDNFQESPFCDVLGRNERRWFQAALLASTAPVKLIVSGSVAMGNPDFRKSPCNNKGDVAAWLGSKTALSGQVLLRARKLYSGAQSSTDQLAKHLDADKNDAVTLSELAEFAAASPKDEALAAAINGKPKELQFVVNNPLCGCSSDDLECYRAAQLSLFHTIKKASGCSVILAGDYHWSDIKVPALIAVLMCTPVCVC